MIMVFAHEGLVAMWKAAGRDCVFMEMAQDVGANKWVDWILTITECPKVPWFRFEWNPCMFHNTIDVLYCRHMFIECVPLEAELGDVAPVYFKASVFIFVFVTRQTTYQGNWNVEIRCIETIYLVLQKAINECEGEYTDNKKLIELRVRGEITRLFPLIVCKKKWKWNWIWKK